MIFGTSTVFSSCCWTRKNTATPSARPGDTVNATRIAGIAEISGPTIGIISPMPAISASTKKYGTPISPRPIAVVAPITKPRKIWPPSHALTFCGHQLADLGHLAAGWRRGNSRTKKSKMLCDSTSM